MTQMAVIKKNIKGKGKKVQGAKCMCITNVYAEITTGNANVGKTSLFIYLFH